MNYKELFNRLLLLISSQAFAGEEILIEEDKRKVLGGFVYPLIGLCGLSVFLGSISFDFEVFTLQAAMTKACSILVSLFGGYFLAAYLVNLYGIKALKREPELILCQQFVGYSMSVLFVLDIVLGLFPSFFILRWILQFYIVWVVWEGAQKLMEVKEEKLLSYTLVVSAIIILSPIVLKMLFDYLSVTLR
mgnify:CR=1 FL=1